MVINQEINEKLDYNDVICFHEICDFHTQCLKIIECDTCSTVIWCFYDERNEPNFKCPTCTNYVTNYKYYTKEQIESSKELQEVIKSFKVFNQLEIEIDDRMIARKGLNDWELSKKLVVNLENYIYWFQLHIDSITYPNKYQGLRLKIYKIDKNTNVIISIKTIPLSKGANLLYFLSNLIKKTEYERNAFFNISNKNEIKRKFKK